MIEITFRGAPQFHLRVGSTRLGHYHPEAFVRQAGVGHDSLTTSGALSARMEFYPACNKSFTSFSKSEFTRRKYRGPLHKIIKLTVPGGTCSYCPVCYQLAIITWVLAAIVQTACDSQPSPSSTPALPVGPPSLCPAKP